MINVTNSTRDKRKWYADILHVHLTVHMDFPAAVWMTRRKRGKTTLLPHKPVQEMTEARYLLGSVKGITAYQKEEHCAWK